MDEDNTAMANTTGDNERKACDAVTRVIEDLINAKRSNDYSPERNNIKPPIDYVFDLGKEKYAMEHTIVEAFDGQIQTDVHFASFVTPITDALDCNLPTPGTYRLCFQIDPSRGIKAKQLPGLQERVIAWVKRSAGELHAECPDQPQQSEMPRGHRSLRKETIDGVVLELSRETGWWMPEESKGRLFPLRFAPGDYETLRRKRLQITMDRKLTKLQGWKNNGTRSVLVLEDRDIALSNHVVILEAAEHALQGRMPPPDEVWLVDTTMKKQWRVWCLIRDGRSLPDECTSVRFREFNPCDLAVVGAGGGGGGVRMREPIPAGLAGLAGCLISGGRREWQDSGGTASRQPDTADGSEHANGRNVSASPPS